ncbi:ROK family protein [Salibacterium aidingense]|uniref:ROK family protein n=1 Tax=Salibacterium aidingense TaxID=384933 RepID=UPI0003FDC17A|nr:ROK family protein [Salibacterium aidingense]
MKEYTAFDIGGSFIKYGIVKENGDLREHDKMKTPESLDALIQRISAIVHTHSVSAGVAVSSPGAVSEEGIIYGSSAVPYIHGPNMKQLLQEETGMPVFIENDANCAGSAELWKGSAKGRQDVLTVVIGTGIGGAVIKDGKIHKGANLHGGEFGYMLLHDSVSGNDAVWSRLASTKALVKNAAAKKDVEPHTLSGEKVFERADSGDPDCRQAIEEFYRLLAIGLYNLQYIYDPEVILIGGGISARENLVERINEKLDNLLDTVTLGTIRPDLAVCEFRQHANLLGAVHGFIQNLEVRGGVSS